MTKLSHLGPNKVICLCSCRGWRCQWHLRRV